MTPRFLDTNILLRLFTRDDETKALRALELLRRVERGEEQLSCHIVIVFEVVFTLERHYKVQRSQVSEIVWNIISLPAVLMPGKSLCKQALDLYVLHNISFADAYTAIVMKSRGLAEVYSWDTDFDRIDGVKRVEP